MSKKPNKVLQSQLRRGEFLLRKVDLAAYGQVMSGRHGGYPETHVRAVKDALREGLLVREEIDGVTCYVSPPPSTSTAATPVSASRHFGLTAVPQGAMA
jgi:hypothetical protein